MTLRDRCVGILETIHERRWDAAQIVIYAFGFMVGYRRGRRVSELRNTETR